MSEYAWHSLITAVGRRVDDVEDVLPTDRSREPRSAHVATVVSRVKSAFFASGRATA